MKKLWIVLVCLLAAGACAWLSVRIVASLDYHHSDNDFFTFWLAGHLVAQGGSPYDTAAWAAGYRQFEMSVQPNPAFLYPLPLALLLAPLGLLPFQTAYVVWVTLLQLMILAALAVLLAAAGSPRLGLYVLPLLVGLALYRPTVLTLFQGQMSGLFLLLLALAALLWRRERWAWGGVLLGCFALKPNLGAPLLLLLGLWLVWRRRWSALLGAAGAAILLLAAGLVYRPGWIGEYWQVGNAKLAGTFGGSPTVWGLGALACRNGTACTLALGGLAALLLVGGTLWLVLRRRPDLSPLTILGLAITLTLLVTPYTWTYDQLLLLPPILAIVFFLDQRTVHLAIPALLFPALDGLVLVLLIFDAWLKIEILNALVPLLVLAGLAWVSWRRPAEGG